MYDIPDKNGLRGVAASDENPEYLIRSAFSGVKTVLPLFMLRLPFLLKVSRLRFWLYVFGPYLIGLIAGANEPSDFLKPQILFFGLYFLFPANLLIYGINDIFDYETDKLNEKKIEYETLVEPKLQKKLLTVIVFFNLPFVIAAFFHGTKVLLAMAGFLFFSIFYSAPPIRAKSKPILDSIFNILYIFPGVFSYALLTGTFPSWSIIIAGGFWTMAMHAYSAIPDIQADRQADLQTIATELGARLTLVFCSVLYIFSAVLAFPYLGMFGVFLGIIFVAMILISFQFNKTDQLFKVYKFFPVVNSLTGFLLFWQILLSKFDILK